MDPRPVYPILADLTRGFRRSLQKTIAWAVDGLLMHASVSLPHLALHLAASSGIRPGSALTRLYRLLPNPRFREEALSTRLLLFLGRLFQPLLLVVDGTEWPHRRRCLVAAVAVARRALPVAVTVAPAVNPFPSQNHIEEAFLERLLASLGTEGLQAVLLFDRDFARPSLMRFLQERAGPALGWVIRLPRHLGVVREEGAAPVPLGRWPVRPGQAVDLGWVEVGSRPAVRVRVVGVWARGRHEPWWLATNLSWPVAQVAAIYDRRMAIEQMLRDGKGGRFGVGLRWTQVRRSDALQWLWLLVGLALWVWMALGVAAVRGGWVRWRVRFSLVRIGRGLMGHGGQGEPPGLLPLPPPWLRLRSFAWIAGG